MEENFELKVRKRATWKFILFFILTLGYYPYIWLWKLIKDLNSSFFEQEKKISFWQIAFFPIVLDVIDIYYTIINWNSDEFTSWDKFYFKAVGIIYLIISVYLLKRFEEYALKVYGIKIKHNGIGVFFFNFIYVNFAMNTFSKRVQKASEIAENHVAIEENTERSPEDM